MPYIAVTLGDNGETETGRAKSLGKFGTKGRIAESGFTRNSTGTQPPRSATSTFEADFDLLEFTWQYVLKDNEAVAAFQQEFAARKAEFEGRKSRQQRNYSKQAHKTKSKPSVM